MTQAQKKLAIDTLKELEELAPNVKWAMTWNYYTKLPEFIATGARGGVSFDMFKRERMERITQENGITYNRYSGEKYAELSATVDATTKDEGGVIVSGAHNFDALPKATITKELPRVNFKKYIQFIKDNLSLLEQIGA